MSDGGGVGDGTDDGDGGDVAHPPVVSGTTTAAAEALAAGSVIAVPSVGGYCLAVRAGTPEVESKLVQLAADPEGPHYAVGRTEELRALTSGWTDELGTLLERCWPGPLEVFVPRAAVGTGPVDGPADQASDLDPVDTGPDTGGWAVVVGMPDGRVLRRLCRESGPWRTVPLSFTEAGEVAQAFDAADVALVVDGGRRDGLLATLVDATVSPIRVLREGALPAHFIEGTMLMSTRRRFSLLRRGRNEGGSA